MMTAARASVLAALLMISAAFAFTSTAPASLARITSGTRSFALPLTVGVPHQVAQRSVQSRRPLAPLEWDNTSVAGGLFRSKIRSASKATPVVAVTALLLASIKAPAVGGTASAAFGIATAVQALKNASAERVFFLGSLATVVLVGVLSGISFGSALCALAVMA